VSGTTGWLLAIDTATTTIVVAVGSPAGALRGVRAFEGRYRHSQELLPAIAGLTGELGLGLPDLAGIIVGTGPGAFTGLRVGLATAKTLAHELQVPVVGIGTDAALLATTRDEAAVLWMPSGPRDLVRIAADADPTIIAGAGVDAIGAHGIAVDLAGRAPDAAIDRGDAALAGLPASLLRLGAERLAAGDHDDPERLVPRYATPPRGAPSSDPEGGVAWSRDPR